MFQFIESFGNPLALLLSIVATVIISLRWKKTRPETTRRFLVGLLYWGPVLLMTCMLLHLLLNAQRAIVSIRDTGVFNFYFYSLQLFGVVVGYQSYRLLKSCRSFVEGGPRLRRELLQGIGLILLTTVPTIAFTIIGVIPPAVLTITFFAALGIHRSTKAPRRSANVKTVETTPSLPASAVG